MPIFVFVQIQLLIFVSFYDIQLLTFGLLLQEGEGSLSIKYIFESRILEHYFANKFWSLSFD